MPHRYAATPGDSSARGAALPAVPRWRYVAARLLVWISLGLLGLDTIYKYYYGITYAVRENCIIYSSLPRWAFLALEQILELFLVVVVGVFFATILERQMPKLGRYVPGNPLTAFGAAALLPACSCSAIPLVSALRERASFATVVTFVVAAPLLNPYIIVLSFSVLGTRYALLRIGASLLVSLVTGYVAQLALKRIDRSPSGLPPLPCHSAGCRPGADSAYEATLSTVERLSPYLAVAGCLGLAVSWWGPDRLLYGIDLSGDITSGLLAILIGVPVYFCNGADVIFLKPFLYPEYLPLGSALAFSLTSSSVCATSLVLLSRYLGKVMTGIVLATIVVLTFVVAVAINLIF